MKPWLISAIFVLFVGAHLPKELAAAENEVEAFALEEQLLQAIRNGKPELVEDLLKRGANPNKPLSGEVFRPLDAALMDGLVAKEVKVQIAQLLIKSGAAKPNQTSLNHIVNQRLDKVIDALIAANPADESLMEVAITRGDLGLVKRLLQAGYPPSVGIIRVNGLLARANPLQAAIALGRADIVKTLLEAGASHRLQEEVGGTSISNMDLIARSSPDILKIFLEKGLSPSAKNSQGKNLLMLAAGGGKADSIHLLISRGAKVDAKDQYGDTPLIYAARFGTRETVKALLAHGPKLYFFASGGHNAKVLAFHCGRQEIVDVLEQAGMEGYAGKGIPQSPFEHEIADKIHEDITSRVYTLLPILPPGLRFFSVATTSSFSVGKGEGPLDLPKYSIYAVFADRRVVKLVAPSDFQVLGFKITSGRNALRLVRAFDDLALREFTEIPRRDWFVVGPLDRLKKAGITEPKVELLEDGRTFVIKRFGLPISTFQLQKRRSAIFDTMIRSVEMVGQEGQYTQTTQSVAVTRIFARLAIMGR